MLCPFCMNEETRVVDSRLAREQQAVRRRRHCDGCNRRFTTYERVEMVLPAVVKRDGRREPFDLQKIRTGVDRACQKRPVSVEAKDELMRRIETHFTDRNEREVATSDVGEVVLSELRALDQVAYVRFASVYRKFHDVEEFAAELRRLAPGRVGEEDPA
jgi:transcriptional repressor NrdR